ARGVGINVYRISMIVFALGAFLAAVAGVVAGGFVGVYPGADFEILPYAFVVVIVGGMGSLKGALIGSLMVGLLDNFGKALFPELSYFTLFAPMAAILAVRPTALLVLLVAPPMVSSFLLALLTQAVIYAVLAMSLDLILGYIGLSSLGHAAY